TNQTFLPSAFSPSNILDASSWSKFTLDGQAVRALAEDAPASLRGRLGDQADVDIESLSFEFVSLRVERSSFVPDVFEAHLWKLPEGAPEVSAGDEAARGSCPAYIAALVVARRLTMVLKPQSERNAKTLQLFRTKALALGAFKI